LVTLAQIENRLSGRLDMGSWVWQRRKMPVPLIEAFGCGFWGIGVTEALCKSDFWEKSRSQIGLLRHVRELPYVVLGF
jgi:hypothetical protein